MYPITRQVLGAHSQRKLSGFGNTSQNINGTAALVMRPAKSMDCTVRHSSPWLYGEVWKSTSARRRNSSFRRASASHQEGRNKDLLFLGPLPFHDLYAPDENKRAKVIGCDLPLAVDSSKWEFVIRLA